MARKMKDSGIEWIGEIPEGWEISKVSYFYEVQLGKMLQPQKKSETDTEEKYLCAANVGKNSLSLDALKTMWFSQTEKHQFDLKEGDLLVVEGGDVASCAIIETPVRNLFFQNALHRVRPLHNESVTFLRYWLMTAKSYGYIDLICNKATIAHFSKEKFIALPIPVIPQDIQSKIVSYLDLECKQIEDLLSKTRSSIEEYKKLKQAVITQAVATQQCSHIKLKYLMNVIVDCPHETPTYSFTGNYYVIRTADQALASLRRDEDMYRLDASEYKKRTRRLTLDKDDIVYGREGERWGLACIVPKSNKYCLGQRIMQFRCNTKFLYPKYAMYALNSEPVYLQGVADTIGSTSPHVNISTVCNYLLPVPALTEQKEIANYLDAKCAEIDRLIAKKEQLVKELESYKKSLIYEVVTGKREV